MVITGAPSTLLARAIGRLHTDDRTCAKDEHQELATDLVRLMLWWAMRKYAVRNGAGGRVVAPRAGRRTGRSADGCAPLSFPPAFPRRIGSAFQAGLHCTSPVLQNRQGVVAPRLEGSIPSPLRFRKPASRCSH